MGWSGRGEGGWGHWQRLGAEGQSRRDPDLAPPLCQTVRELLENPTQAVNDMSYFNCLDSVMENSKVRSGLISGQGKVGLGEPAGRSGCWTGEAVPSDCRQNWGGHQALPALLPCPGLAAAATSC